MKTARLIIRHYEPTDAARYQELASDRRIAVMTGPAIPHPYPDGFAAEWIAKQHSDFSAASAFEKGVIQCALVLKTGELIGGACLFGISKDQSKAEVGYWIGVPYWNQGFATEAAAAMIKYGFETLGLNKISAKYSTENPASGRVLEKLGFVREGLLREEATKLGATHDLIVVSLLKREFISRSV